MRGLVQSPLLQIPGLVHGFTTRELGTAENEKIEKSVSTARQVHKAGFIWLNAFEKKEREADGLGTLEPGRLIGVYSADCTPALLAFSEGDKTLGVMAVHAGWRGTAQGILGKAVHAFTKASGKNGLHLRAAIGPCISAANFEVGQDVIDAFPSALAQGIARKLRIENGKQKYLFDLPAENQRQLAQAAKETGTRLEVDAMGLCTVADPDRFPSYRRDRGGQGRILSYIAFGTDPSELPW